MAVATDDVPVRAGTAADCYVASVVTKYAVDVGAESAAAQVAKRVTPLMKQWAGPHLLGVGLSGSYAKGTAVSVTSEESHVSFAKDAKRRWGTLRKWGTSTGTDVDVFISLSPAAGQSVKEIYWNLFLFCADHGLKPTPGNVSVRVVVDEVKVDLVPGRRQEGNAGDHTLYSRRKDSWMQTNVGQHIQLVAGCGRRDEIRAMKVWRERQRLDFPSFYLELVVMEALRNAETSAWNPTFRKPRNVGHPREERDAGLAANVRETLRYVAEDFGRARVVDPANSNNVISEELWAEEKGVIVRAARRSLAMTSWENVLW